jgi:hypothetical protein
MDYQALVERIEITRDIAAPPEAVIGEGPRNEPTRR